MDRRFAVAFGAALLLLDFRAPDTSAETLRSHVVQPGETLFSIARERLNHVARWKEILDLNRTRIPHPDRLTPGLELLIPSSDIPNPLSRTSDPEDQVSSPTRPLRDESPPPPRQPVSDSSNVRGADPSIHVVQRGQTLYQIARDRLGTAARWKEILSLNRKMISSPDYLAEGMTLRLPLTEKSHTTRNTLPASQSSSPASTPRPAPSEEKYSPDTTHPRDSSPTSSRVSSSPIPPEPMITDVSPPTVEPPVPEYSSGSRGYISDEWERRDAEWKLEAAREELSKAKTAAWFEATRLKRDLPVGKSAAPGIIHPALIKKSSSQGSESEWFVYTQPFSLHEVGETKSAFAARLDSFLRSRWISSGHLARGLRAANFTILGEFGVLDKNGGTGFFVRAHILRGVNPIVTMTWNASAEPRKESDFLALANRIVVDLESAMKGFLHGN